MNTNDWENTWGKINWVKDTPQEILKKIEELISAGADVNARDKMGNNALMHLALLSSRIGTKGYSKIAQTLIYAGSDTKVRKVCGRMALNVPKKSDMKNLIQSANLDPVKMILNYVIREKKDKQRI